MDEETRKKIRTFTRREFSEDELYTFDVKLCDNEIDRDYERFSSGALAQMKELFVGKTGIFDHNPKGENQAARIYDTALVTEPDRITSAGEPYTYLKGSAYMVRTAANTDLIREIDGGIKKEVSVSCCAAQKICSICGKNSTNCPHHPGQMYTGTRCHAILDDITDAYEWSFVAIPAQREAGVTKRFSERTEPDLTEKIAHLSRALDEAETRERQTIVRLRYLVDGDTGNDAISAVLDTMSLQQLYDFEDRLRKKQHPGGKRQLPTNPHQTEPDDCREFRI